MNDAVDRLRQNQGRSVENIMMELIMGNPEGPNTSVEGLMHAAFEASRIYLLEKQIRQEERMNTN